MLNHKSTRSARLFWLGALLGTAVFLLVYGLAPLDAANDAFCRGGYIEKDIQQHYAGWLFYRSSALGWPLGVTQAVNAPQGVSVAYTDSIPLLAVLCRPLAAALGGTFQYFGWFTLVCFALQGGFAALLCGLFANALFAPLAGALVFTVSPVLIERAFRHSSLGAQWLVLAALYCYFSCRRQGRYASAGLFIINVLAVGIHPYFLPMTYAVTLALLLEYAVTHRQWLRPAALLIGNMACTAALGWALGLLYGTATSGGQALYGYFAMNLNALWNPVGVNGVLYSRLLPAQNQVEGNYDAFAYLGGWFTGWSPARFGAELYGAAYNGFYANTIMVAAYYAFVVVTLALGFALDARRAFTYKNKPSEICLANEKHRWGIYYVLVICLLVGYIMQNGGFGGASGFGMYANF